MESLRKPKGRMFYYVLMTRCAHCQFLRKACVKTFKPQYASGQYCVAKTKSVIRHPETGKITHQPGSLIFVDAGVEITVFCCPRNPELMFVSSLAFAENCMTFEPKEIHHQMPDGKKVTCR